MNPVCPRCDEFCEVGDERCACGARLYVTPRSRPAVRVRASRPHLLVACACGCGETFSNTDMQGRLRRYVRGHSLNLKPAPTLSPAALWWASRFVPEEIRDLGAELV